MTVVSPLNGIFSRGFDKPSDFLCCVCGLRTTEVDVYFTLLSGEKTVEELRTIIQKDRTTIQRALNKLCKKGLIVREARTIPRGGYYYVYKALSTKEIKQKILKQLDEWYQKTRTFLLNMWTNAQ